MHTCILSDNSNIKSEEAYKQYGHFSSVKHRIELLETCLLTLAQKSVTFWAQKYRLCLGFLWDILFVFLNTFFSWNKVDIQYYVSFRCTA